MSLTAGYTIDCTTKAPGGGASDVLIANEADVASFTQSSTAGANLNSYTAVAMNSSATFYNFQFDEQSAGWKETMKRSEQGNVSWEFSLEFSLAGSTQAKRNTVMELAGSRCGLVVIVRDMNGVISVFNDVNAAKPKVRLFLKENEAMSGIKYDDFNGEKMVIGGRLFEKHNKFSGLWSAIPKV